LDTPDESLEEAYWQGELYERSQDYSLKWLQHPLNAEADLRELFDAGMITPTQLHYVRNHGSVPKLAWETHSLEVFSDPPELLPQGRSFSMDELAEMPAIEIAVTIACDGNRRGEVNMVKRSSGFTWSSSGVSTCKWKGILVRDLLLRCGFDGQERSSKLYLHYEGADEPSEGKYATSIALSHAMNPRNDVLLAYGEIHSNINFHPIADPNHSHQRKSLVA
jgi:nitrate reductase (NAD(P)H)